MAPFDGDQLDPALTHGDVVIAISAHHMDTASHALRELLRPTRDALALRWWIDGFQGADRGPTKRSARRNLFGFRDGTGNPAPTDDALMRQLVWTPEGGTYMAVRLIRMHLEFWDRVGLREQEGMIGRRRDTGAPLGGRDEFDDPRLDLDPKGERVPLDSPHPARQPAHHGHRRPAPAAARLELPARLRPGRPARPGADLRRPSTRTSSASSSPSRTASRASR